MRFVLSRCMATSKTGPLEVRTVTRRTALIAVLEPESTAGSTRRAVAEHVVVVAVNGGKLHSVVVRHCVRSGVSRESRDAERVTRLFAVHREGAVLRPEPRAIAARRPQINSQLEVRGSSEPVQNLVADPVVTGAVVESDLVFGPRATKDARPVSRILLDQQRDAVI